MAIYRNEFVEIIENLGAEVTATSIEHLRKTSQFLEGDDWSFIIKSVALTESVLTAAIVSTAGNEKFQRHFDRQPLHSKISLVHELDLVDDIGKRFLLFVSELRNRLAHKVDELSFTFDAYLANMGEKEKRVFVDSIRISEIDNKREYAEAVLGIPKKMVWLNLVSILSLVSAREQITRITREVDELGAITMEEILKQLAPELFERKK